ncbi:MAG: hypothetical protein WCI49_15815 [Ferruginibacter sp.]
MKKTSIVLLAVAAIIFAACSHKSHPSKAMDEAVVPAKPAPTTYASGIQAIITGKCAPCHLPSKGGNKENLESFDAVKKNITNMIARVEKNPIDRGFMPMKNAKLSDEEIATLKKWVADGLLEK